MQKLNAVDKKVRDMRQDGPNFVTLNHQAADFPVQYVKALNWVHYNVDEAELRDELNLCLVERKAEHLAAFVADLDGVTFSTLGKIAYCLNRGADLAPQSVMRIRNALEQVRDRQMTPTVVVLDQLAEQDQTAAGRVNDVYKACYSRIDNVKARMLMGKITLDQVADEVNVVLDTQEAKSQVRKRLLDHYKQSLQEALADKTIRTWVKPLQKIVQALGGDVKQVKQKVKNMETKVKKARKAKTEPAKAVKAKAVKPVKATKKPRAAKAETRTVVIKPKRVAAAPTTASLVRDLIRTNKAQVDEKGMIDIVIRELGLTKERGRSVVKAFWSKIEV